MNAEMGTMKEISVRRRYDVVFKWRVLVEHAEPGTSVVGVALCHGINANFVQTWRQEARQASAP
jgi:transposase-like protein